MEAIFVYSSGKKMIYHRVKNKASCRYSHDPIFALKNFYVSIGSDARFILAEIKEIKVQRYIVN